MYQSRREKQPSSRIAERMSIDENTLLESAGDRIRRHRTALIRLHLRDEQGSAVRNADVRVRLTRHRFKFGCNAYCLDRIEDPVLQEEYRSRFADLLNYATLPFYWGGYEKSKGVTEKKRLEKMYKWIEEQIAELKHTNH